MCFIAEVIDGFMDSSDIVKHYDLHARDAPGYFLFLKRLNIANFMVIFLVFFVGFELKMCVYRLRTHRWLYAFI